MLVDTWELLCVCVCVWEYLDLWKLLGALCVVDWKRLNLTYVGE